MKPFKRVLLRLFSALLVTLLSLLVRQATLTAAQDPTPSPGPSTTPDPSSVTNAPSSSNGPTAPPTVSSSSRTIYSLGDLIVKNPVEASTIFVTTVLVAAVVELVIARLRRYESKYFQLVFRSVTEESLLVGIMTLLLIFVISLGVLHPKWVILLNYAVMSLLYMLGFFVVISLGIVFKLRLEMNRWRDFEAARMDADSLLSRKEVIFKECRDRFRESIIAMNCPFHRHMMFTDYMRKVERYTVACVCDLGWKSWAALGLIVIVNGVRSKISVRSTDATSNADVLQGLSRNDRLANVASYIAFVGWGTLIGFLILHFKLQQRLAKFAVDGKIATTNELGEVEVVKPSEFLFFGRMETTAHIFQSVILILEWYLAVFVLGMGYEVYREFGYLSILFYVAAVLPVIIFVAVFPWTITTIAVLRSLGSDLDTAIAAEVYERVSMRAGNAENKSSAAGSKGAGASPGGGGQSRGAFVKQAPKDEWVGITLSLGEGRTAKPGAEDEGPAALVGAVHKKYAGSSGSGGKAQGVDLSKGYKEREAKPVFQPLDFSRMLLPDASPPRHRAQQHSSPTHQRMEEFEETPPQRGWVTRSTADYSQHRSSGDLT